LLETAPVCYLYLDDFLYLELSDNLPIMRLLQLKDDGEFSLIEFVSNRADRLPRQIAWPSAIVILVLA